jgi:hypothetical protein
VKQWRPLPFMEVAGGHFSAIDTRTSRAGDRVTRTITASGGWLAAVVLSLLSGGCLNMSTPPAQITGSPGSGIKYEEYTCAQLIDELGALSRREMQLSAAQEQRVKVSNVQALLIGIGQGDGTEASELADLRGEKDAVRKAMIVKRCGA